MSSITISCAIIGAEGVGKTAFIARHLTGEFINIHVPTEKAKSQDLTFLTDIHGKITFEVTESRDLPSNKPGVLFAFFDKTRKETLIDTEKTIEEARKKFGINMPIILCANKIDHRDAEGDPQYFQTIHRLRNNYNVVYFEISAKSNYQFDKPFLHSMRDILGRPTLKFVEKLSNEKISQEFGVFKLDLEEAIYEDVDGNNGDDISV